MTEPTPSSTIAGDQAARQKNLAILAQAPADVLQDKFNALAPPPYELVRQPETGLVMVRGRMGGTGSPFNLGEVTVTRCVVRLDSGETGSAYALGRDKTKALQSAVIDALWQRGETRAQIEADVLAPLSNSQTERKSTVREETEATRVNFFTMVRGDN
ncbi:phosphonate C-P lyase system protein PhnG [Labrenzia sp. PHM005]|uniref:phosphonate C-P lyase system protein PhnG n=1 Tax=Labrenzia sp. PHM005 TaxID=2590016 RepID=UPI00143D5AA2|nr:phosphonate C-P lyase system protein PhnG [Labrenzia sp. PHM005]